MASYILGFMDPFVSYSSSIDTGGLWNSASLVFSVEGSGTHNGEGVATLTGSVPTYRSFTAAVYTMAGIEGRNLIRGAGSWTVLAGLAGSNNDANAVWKLQITNAGALALYYGSGTGTQLGISANNLILSGTFYTIEVAFAAVGASLGSCEVRLNGSRITALTTTNIGPDSAGSAGSVTRGTWNTQGSPDRVHLNFNNIPPYNSAVLYYYWQKSNNTTLWTTVDTVVPPVDFNEMSDFVGQKLKSWVYPNAPGNYRMPASGGTSNWTAAVGAYPASIADQPGGMDSGSSYIQDASAGGGAGVDKISHTYSNLPASPVPVRIGWVQRTVWAEYLAGTTTATMRTGLRAPAGADGGAGDTMDPTATLSGGWTTGGFVMSEYYAKPPYAFTGKFMWTPARVGISGSTVRMEGILESVTLT